MRINNCGALSVQSARMSGASNLFGKLPTTRYSGLCPSHRIPEAARNTTCGSPCFSDGSPIRQTCIEPCKRIFRILARVRLALKTVPTLFQCQRYFFQMMKSLLGIIQHVKGHTDRWATSALFERHLTLLGTAFRDTYQRPRLSQFYP